MIDSGVDYTIFPAALGERLGLNIESGKKESVSGVSGVALVVYFHHLLLEMDGKKFKIYAGFSNNLNHNFAILGQNGFFNLFKVNLDFKRKEVQVNPKNS